MEETLRQLQVTQLEILKVFDKFCREHNLKYSLYAGSLLGAVRHKGFIPWDDDLDVCMSRSDYGKFLELWQKTPVEGYILQNKENSKYFDQSFSKIRKDHTTFLQDEWQIGNHHTGIFLDIFPIDRIPNGKLKRAIFKWHCMKYQLLTREFVPPKSNAVVRLGSAVILACTPKKRREKVRQNTLKKITRYNDQHEFETVAIEIIRTINKPLPADMMDEYVDLPFEDGKFMCIAGWDEYLRRKFGDYMQLPPEEERAWRHHPILIDFEHNYEDIQRELG